MHLHSLATSFPESYRIGGTIWFQWDKVETVIGRLSPLASAGLHIREETRYQPPDIWAPEEREMSLDSVRRLRGVSPRSVHVHLVFPLLGDTDAAAARLVVRHAAL